MAGPDLEQLFHRYVDCLNARRIDELAELVDDALLHNGEEMTRAARLASGPARPSS